MSSGLDLRLGAKLTPAEFDYLRSLVRERSAIVLEPGKEYLLESRLAPLVRRQGLSGLGELVTKLRASRTGPLHDEVVDAMTTNETSWFRDVHPWESLRSSILPELVAARRATRELSIWCAASSSGQEPYTLAMILRDHFPEVVAGWRLKIVATDLSPSMIERSKAGRYSQLEVNRGLPTQLLVRWFERSGAEYQLKPEIRSMVEFRLLNLATMWHGLPPCDLVMMRNVLIYFDRDTKRQILGRVARQLRPGGYLVLGSSETTFNIDEAWTSRTIGKTIVYQAGAPRPAGS